MDIILDDHELSQKLNVLAARLLDTRKLTVGLAASLLHTTEENFANEGRPKWAGLNPQYAAQRGKGKILQLSGALARSITPFSTATTAGLSTTVPYAAIHQFGGTTRPHVIKPDPKKGKKALFFNGHFAKQVNHPGSKIPARPFLPITANGNLQPEALPEIWDVVSHWWGTGLR